MPSLVSVSSANQGDSGHDSGPVYAADYTAGTSPAVFSPPRPVLSPPLEPSPAYSPITPRVTVNFEKGIYSSNICLNDYFDRSTRTKVTEEKGSFITPGPDTKDNLENDIIRFMILNFITYLTPIYYRHHLNHVTTFPGY